MPRDDFSQAMAAVISKRAGLRCAFPSCGAATIGPSEASASATSSVGVAAHITAAARGGPRYDPSLTPEERSAPTNGIWMCATHGKLIDTDAVSFPVQTLLAWKEEVERRAKSSIGVPLGPKSPDDPLLNQLIEFSEISNVNQSIGVLVDKSGAPVSLGEQPAYAIRDLLIEQAKNAFKHGGADKISVSIEARRISLSDNGGYFALEDVLKSPQGRGGKHAIQAMEQHQNLMLVYERIGSINRMTVTPLAHLPHNAVASPCTLTLTVQHLTEMHHWDATPFSKCGKVYVNLPPYLTLSDVYMLGPGLKRFAKEIDRPLVLLMGRYSSSVIGVLQSFAPTALLVSRQQD